MVRNLFESSGALMKVLILGNLSSTIILFRSKLIKKLVSLGYSVTTLTMDNDAVNFLKIQNLGAIPLKYEFSRSGMNPFSDFKNTFKLSKMIKVIQPDIVFCFFPKPVIFGTLAARYAGIKKVNVLLEGLGYCFTQRDEGDNFKKKLVKYTQILLYKFSLPLAKKVMFLNSDDYTDLVLKNRIKINDYKIIGGIGVDLKYYTYVPPSLESLHFVMVSRLLVDKGVREFVSAASIVKKKYPHVRFSIAGALDDNPGGISRNEYELWAKAGDVEFLGQINDIKSYLTKSSVFILPSYREGIPRSTQEAMAIGRAVITTDVPGCRETIIDGKNGYMIPPWNAESLAEKIECFIKNPSSIITMGIESRNIAESKFDEDLICDNLINILTVDELQ